MQYLEIIYGPFEKKWDYLRMLWQKWPELLPRTLLKLSKVKNPLAWKRSFELRRRCQQVLIA